MTSLRIDRKGQSHSRHDVAVGTRGGGAAGRGPCACPLACATRSAVGTRDGWIQTCDGPPDNACSMLLAPTVIQENTIVAFVWDLFSLHNGIIYRITSMASRARDANYGISGES